MNILAIYPALDPAVNDIYNVLIHLTSKGHNIRVVTAISNKSKSSNNRNELEVLKGIQIFRPYEHYFPDMILWPEKRMAVLQKYLSDFKPDVILCSQEFTIRLGLVIKKWLADSPLITIVSEFAGNLADRGYSGLIANLTYPLVGMPRGKNFWPWLQENSSAVITCYPPDVARLDELGKPDKPVYYSPWCNQLPEGINLSGGKEQGLAVYIGAFSKWKNTDEFLSLVPRILEDTPTQQVLFIGKGKINILQKLKKRYGKAVEHIPGLQRKEALVLLSTAFFGVTPVKKGGWGFYGDCWAVRTPVASLYNDYGLNHKHDAIVGNSIEGLIEGINKLYDDPALYTTLQECGYNRYSKYHTALAVGMVYENVLLNSQTRVFREAKSTDL